MTRPDPPRAVILAILAGVFAIGQFHRAAGSVTTPILIENLSVSATAISLVMAIMFLATVSGQLPLGAMLDRVGARIMLSVTTMLVAIGTAVFALASDYGQFLVARVLIGLGFAVSGAAIHVIIASSFPRRDFAYVQGLIAGFGGVGGLLATYPLAVLLERLPWTTVFWSLSGLTALLVLLMLRYIPRPKPAPLSSGGAGPGYLELLRLAEMRKILAMALVVWSPIVIITGLWGSAYYQDMHGFSPEAAGAVIFALSAATMIGAFAFGWLDRNIPRRKGLILTAGTASALCYLGLGVLSAPPAGLTVALLVTMVFCQQFHVVVVAHLRAIVPPEVLGRASALFTLVAVIAIPSLQMGFGAILDLAELAGWSRETGFRLGFGAVGAIILCGTAVYSTARRANDN